MATDKTPEESAGEAERLRAFLNLIDQWRTAEVDLTGTGAHRVPSGGYLFQCEFTVSAVVPNAEAVERLRAALSGTPVDVIEASPVTSGEQAEIGF